MIAAYRPRLTTGRTQHHAARDRGARPRRALPRRALSRGVPDVEERRRLRGEALVPRPPVQIVARLLAGDLLIQHQRLLVRRPVGLLRLHLAVLARAARGRLRDLALRES